MLYELFESLVRQLSHPRKLLLNYSGESTVYPELIPAIQLASSTGAEVELVTALVNMGDAALPALCASGVNRLTVSVHSTDPARYREIYRYGSFEALENKLKHLVKLSREVPNGPVIDLAFVAMDSNLEDLLGVAQLAQALGLRDIQIFPIIRRDQIPIQFPAELSEPDVYSAAFQERVTTTVEQAKELSAVSIAICNAAFASGNDQLGAVPRPFPGVLPVDAEIHTCEQNPWETMHVLSNGDVVACERLDKIPLGNLQKQPLSEIWHSEAYGRFRDRYRKGEISECRTCPWKWAYRPAPPQPDILAARGVSSQLLHGWHSPSGEAHIWSSQQAAAVIARRTNSQVLRVAGMLPPGFDGDPNELVILCNHTEIGRVSNAQPDVVTFELDLTVETGQESEWFIEFRTRHLYRPSKRGSGSDRRDLGFALVLLASMPCVNGRQVESRRRELLPLCRAINSVDRIGRFMGRLYRNLLKKRDWLLCPEAPLKGFKDFQHLPNGRGACPSFFQIPRGLRAPAEERHAPGLSVLIPERDNVSELSCCLASLQEAASCYPEPVQTIVLVNGSRKEDYRELSARYPAFHWRFEEKALGFSGAVEKGLRSAVFDWVYLLNSDVSLDRNALVEVGKLRGDLIFSVASQILLKDRTRFRDETNWTALFLEDGVAAIHDLIPKSMEPVEGFYAGGGASLFQAGLLRRFARVSAYDPFYWEDVEWGWRARKMGYRSIFCPGSVAHHTQRSTISRHYPPSEIDRIIERNRFLFQLRNFTTVGSLERVIQGLTLSSHNLDSSLVKSAMLWQITRARFWNHLAAISDEEVLANWNIPVSIV